MISKRILIVGGGMAGVRAAIGAARSLRSAGGQMELTIELISPSPWMVVRPRLYEADLAGVRVPLDPLLASIGVRLRRGHVAEIDARARTVRLAERAEPIHYNQLVLSAGSRLQHPWQELVHTVDTYSEALALHERIAELAARPGAQMSAVVVGGGFTGIEVAAELSGMLEQVAPGRQRGPITLIERAPSVAPEFGPHARALIERALRSLGVELRTGAAVREVREDGVVLADRASVDGELVVWASGPRASELTEQVAGARDPLGRLIVDCDLASQSEGVWAAGDSACARADRQHTALMSCQHALAQGAVAGANAVSLALGRRPQRYRQPLYLTCLDLGPAGALLTCGFERNRVLAHGAEAKHFKRYINRSLIYPPADAQAAAILALGRRARGRRSAARLSGLALRSGRVRAIVCDRAEDRAAQFAEIADQLLGREAAL
ncbi:MAG TPA: FAD-dependent oxidoreductase [Solirubrobacteraceae bacterium]|nr:FAD-dependent oxidoreductase [Solirubrobacteraceae bacterium]